VLTGNGEPHLWDFGSAAAHHRIYAPWLQPICCHAGNVGLRGTIPPDQGLVKRAAQEIYDVLKQQGVRRYASGYRCDRASNAVRTAKLGLKIVDGQQVMLDAREIKSRDEIMLLNTAAAMVDGVYQDIYEALKPGVRESDIVAMATSGCSKWAPTDVEAINAVAGERCSPHPHNFTDRIIRPGDQAFFDIIQPTWVTAPATTAPSQWERPAMRKRMPIPRRANGWMPGFPRFGPGSGPTKSRPCFPRAEEFGFPNEMEAFALQFGHGLGVALHERPIISRLVSLDHPLEIKEGMVFALETYCPASDGRSAARIEEELVVTNKGCEVITLFPAQELPIANRY